MRKTAFGSLGIVLAIALMLGLAPIFGPYAFAAPNDQVSDTATPMASGTPDAATTTTATSDVATTATSDVATTATSDVATTATSAVATTATSGVATTATPATTTGGATSPSTLPSTSGTDQVSNVLFLTVLVILGGMAALAWSRRES